MEGFPESSIFFAIHTNLESVHFQINESPHPQIVTLLH